MVESNVRKEPTMYIDEQRGMKRWFLENLYNPDIGQSGEVPNPGDEVVETIAGKAVIKTVTHVDYTTGRYETMVFPEDLGDGAYVSVSAHVGKEIPMDAGAMARSKLAQRSLAAKAGRLIRWTVAWCLFLAFVAIALTAWYGKYTMVTGRLTDERMCSAPLSEDDAVTGRRTFTYGYREVFGHRIIDTKNITERTEVNVRGAAMTIIGLVGEEPLEDVAMSNNTIEGSVQERGAKQKTGAKWWAVNVGMGENGIQYLKHADSYTFVVGDRVAVVEYASFCR